MNKKFKQPQEEIVRVQCHTCNRDLFIIKSHVKEKMYCTINCMNKTEA